MIRRLAQCPYCHHCEIALDDRPELVFNPESDRQTPCTHLAWVDGRYSQWEHTAQGTDREIGSIEFRWDPDEPGAAERTERLLPYLRELLEAGPRWPYAPAEPFVISTLNADEKATDARGRTYPLWDVDGWAIFAANPAAFWAALPGCQERLAKSLEVDDEKPR
jgi:hypothetical protein